VGGAASAAQLCALCPLPPAVFFFPSLGGRRRLWQLGATVGGGDERRLFESRGGWAGERCGTPECEVCGVMCGWQEGEESRMVVCGVVLMERGGEAWNSPLSGCLSTHAARPCQPLRAAVAHEWPSSQP